MDRLRLALAIGRQQRATAQPLSEPTSSCAGSPRPVVDVGFITAPSNADRRRRIREARDLILARTPAERCAVVITFILGDASLFTTAERRLVSTERRQHNDMVLLRAHDGAAASDPSHGGRAVAEKALAWFIYAANHSRADFVAKVDDDSLVNFPRLVGELRAIA